MQKIYLFCLAIIVSLILISCEKDFNLNAEWKDITIVYSILDQDDTEHYIKITKAFTTGEDGNAIEIAQIPDSLYYDTTDLKVIVSEWKDGIEKKSYLVNPVLDTNKESGAFFSDWQILYKFNADLDEDNIYKLKIENLTSGKVISSESLIVHDFTIDKPRAGGSASFTSVNPTDIIWFSAKNGRRYQITIRFNFKEKSFGSDTIERYTDWVFSPLNSLNTNGGREMKIQYSGQGFYDNINATVPYDDPALEGNIDARIHGYVDYIFSVADDELNTYLDINEPNNSIVEDRPAYTNIDNGIGIFCSRYNKVRSLPLSAPSAEKLRDQGLQFE
ncbi:MAG: DUF4249 domain-containing protein [Bacteroidales bacterium]|nr:DUF4249 domain-containing protein [Bacteroidales bacterium]